MSAAEVRRDDAVVGVLLAGAGSMALASLLLVYAVLRLRAESWPGAPVGPGLPCAGLALLCAAAWGAGALPLRVERALPIVAGVVFLVLQAGVLRSVHAAGAGPGAVLWALALAHAVGVLCALGRSVAGTPARGAWSFAAATWGVIVLAVWGL